MSSINVAIIGVGNCASALVQGVTKYGDVDIMQAIFESTRPDVVFHAAAYKHVPLMERHPIEAFRNNTMSTVSLIRLCEEFDTEQFIFVSTDKVVEPTSVLGATKRLAEWYVRASDSSIRRKIVRFGNVFGIYRRLGLHRTVSLHHTLCDLIGLAGQRIADVDLPTGDVVLAALHGG